MGKKSGENDLLFNKDDFIRLINEKRQDLNNSNTLCFIDVKKFLRDVETNGN